MLGGFLISANRQQDAMALLEAYAASPNADVQVLSTLALAQARANRVGDALKSLERARTQDPSNGALLVEIGTVHLIGGNPVAARAAFEEAIAANPDAARAHRSLAVMAMEEDRPEQALAHWQAAARADPGEYAHLMTMAIALARSNRTAAALPYMKFFADNAPPSRYGEDIARARAWLAARR
jgi:tetratricopeptide (TPR) repeat protein